MAETVKFTKLEAELADEKLLREAQEAALNQCSKRHSLLEAEAAAMRGAIERHRANVWGDGRPVEHDADIILYESLSLKATTLPSPNGMRLVAVVEAAKNYLMFDGDPGARKFLQDALAALEGKP